MLQNIEHLKKVDEHNVSLSDHFQNMFSVPLQDGRTTTYCYIKACQFIRAVEQCQSNNKTYRYKKKFDYYAVAKVLSSAENRIPSFYYYVVNNKSKTNRTLNKRAYDWLMTNAVFENYSMFILEQFNAQLKNDNDNIVWEGFPNWIRSKNIKLANGQRAFKFFDDTPNPLVVV